MARVRTQFSFVELRCLLPNEWKEHPRGVTKMILEEEFRSHLQNHSTPEGLTIEIDNVSAESRGHYNFIWFRKCDGNEIEPDLIKYYPMEIRFYEAVEMSRL